MLKLFGTFLIFSLVLVHENDALRGRNSFEDKIRNCERLCGWPRLPQLPPRPNLPITLPTLAPVRPLGPSRNDNKKCLVLLDHNNATVTLCTANCLESTKREQLGRTVDCECRNRQCIPSNDQTTVAPSTPQATSPPAPTTAAETTAAPTTAAPTTAAPTTAAPTTAAPTTAAPTTAAPTTAAPTP